MIPNLPQFAFLEPADLFGLGYLIVSWFLIGWLIQRSNSKRPSVSQLMADYRREWMREMVTRQPRIFDAQVLATLRQGTSFFASASLLAIGGALAAIGNAETIAGVAQDLSIGAISRSAWEAKLLVTVFLLTNAFLKFVWSHRLFGYCAVLMGAVPNDVGDPIAIPRALKAAELNITASRNYNQGLRSVYFALASVAWLLGWVALLVAATITFAVLWRRDFASRSREIMLMDNDKRTNTQT